NGQTFQCLRGGALTPAFESRNHGLCCVHPLSQLLLRESGGNTGTQDGAGQIELRPELLMSLAVFRILHPLFVKFGYFGHGLISLARFKASAISSPGVFCVFLMNALTTTTRLPTAVT